MAKEREVSGWITVNGHHVPVFAGESSGDAYNRAVAKNNEDIKERQIAQRKAEVDKLNPKKGSKSQEDEYRETAWKYFKDMKPEQLEQYKTIMKGNKVALEQIARAEERQKYLKYYSSIPKENIARYTAEAKKLQGERREWALEGLAKANSRKR